MKEENFRFTERDSELLVALYKHRYLTISQLQRLFFPSMQTAYRRMRLLKKAGMVSSFDVANISESIFAVAKDGMQCVATVLGIEPDQLKWADVRTKPRDYYFMRHFLAINDFRIVLTRACDNSAVELLGFIPDYFGEMSKKGGVRKYIRDVVCDISADREEISHTPDGVFALRKNGKVALFFLEIDRGTEVVSNPSKGVLKSIRFYLSYLMQGGYCRYAKDFAVSEFRGFRSLHITSTEKRLSNIREACNALDVPTKAKLFQWITTSDRVSEESIFQPIWVSIDSIDSRSYQIG